MRRKTTEFQAPSATDFFPPAFRIAAALLACGWLLAGCCAEAPPNPPEQDMARVTGVDGAIRFDTTGGPLDAPAGAPAADAELLTIESAARQALATDPKVQQAIAKVRAAEADAQQARLLPNPVVTLTVRFREAAFASPIITPAISEELLAFITLPRRASAADNAVRAAAADALGAVLDVLVNV